MIPLIHQSWRAVLQDEFEKTYFTELTSFLENEYNTQEVYPRKDEIFRAFELCPFTDAKVIILGQDPYHNENQANGLCFSVSKDVPLPPSLKNIYKEVQNDLKYEPLQHGDLTRWAKQGVLLMNSTLTVRQHSPGSHQKHGWETFTDRVISILSENKSGLVFILWGAYAIKKASSENCTIDQTKHLVLQSPHPSPLSAYKGFFGSKPFSKTNTYLQTLNKTGIDWH